MIFKVTLHFCSWTGGESREVAKATSRSGPGGMDRFRAAFPGGLGSDRTSKRSGLEVYDWIGLATKTNIHYFVIVLMC